MHVMYVCIVSRGDGRRGEDGWGMLREPWLCRYLDVGCMLASADPAMHTFTLNPVRG